MILLTKDQVIRAYGSMGVTKDNLPKKGYILHVSPPNAHIALGIKPMMIKKSGKLYECIIND